MADVHNSRQRSYNMSMIKAKNTRPEMLVRSWLHGQGLRYRLHDRKLPGKPDLVLPKYKTAVFINGCFWHGHTGCRYFVIPKTRTEWWMEKISRNIKRDEEAVKQLQLAGWKVITVWECDLKGEKIRETLGNLLHKIVS